MYEKPAAQPKGGGVSQVVGQIRAERLRFALMRASFAVMAIVTLAFLAWAFPFVPFGASADAYTTASAISVLLGAGTWLTSVAFLLVWAPHFRSETFPDFLRVLFGGNQLIRGRAQFQSRLAAECRRAKQDRRLVFSLIVVQVGTASNGAISRSAEREAASAAIVIRGGVRGDDTVAEVPPNEVWVLALAAPQEGRERVVERLARALLESHASQGPTRSYHIGAGTYGQDGDDADSLFAAARARTSTLAELLEAVPTAA